MRLRHLVVPTALTACSMLFACPAHAVVPSVANSTVPKGIILVGSTGGVADAPDVVVTGPPVSSKWVIYDNSGGTGVAMVGQPVVIDLSACPAEFRLGNQASQYQSGLTVNCPARTLTLSSGPGGVTIFHAIGGATGGCLLSPYQCGLVTVGTTTFPDVCVSILDLDGAGGLGASDVSRWFSQFFCGYSSAGDYDASATLTAGDLAIMLTFFFRAGDTASASVYCP